MKFQTQIFGWGDFPAKTSQSREWDPGKAYEEKDPDCSMTTPNLLKAAAPLLSSSKTYQVCSLPTEGETSKSLFARWPTSGMVWRGECLTAGTSESPNRAKGSLLLPVIETQSLQEKYFLSPNAAKGAIRRADQMGRSLFPPLRQAMEILSKARSSKE
jgi:DNA (cytosine-5)-methyltransferase 1